MHGRRREAEHTPLLAPSFTPSNGRNLLDTGRYATVTGRIWGLTHEIAAGVFRRGNPLVTNLAVGHLDELRARADAQGLSLTPEGLKRAMAFFVPFITHGGNG